MSADAAPIRFRPSHVPLNQQCSTSISWDDGKEIRIYHLGPGNILQEYAYSASKGKKSWHYGNLHDLKIVLNPSSNLAAVRSQGGIIFVYYQDPKDDVIRGLFQRFPKEQWQMYPKTVATAVKDSSIVAVHWVDANETRRFSIFFQDTKLHLREYCWNRDTETWDFGNFNPGVQPRGTPISAEVVHGGDVELNVTWRDACGRTAASSWSTTSGWDLAKAPNNGSQLLDISASLQGLTVDHPLTTISWENGKEIRIYYLDSSRILQEYAYSEKKERNCWYHGELFKLNIVVSPHSVIAAIQFKDENRIYYRDDDSGMIQEARKLPLIDSWVKGATLSKAFASSKIAVIGWTNSGNNIRVYYQEPRLRLQEYCYDNAQWTKGAFNPGAQPPGTPIVAEVNYAGYPAIQVSWKDATGRFVNSRCDKSSRWDLPTTENGGSNGLNPSQLDGSG